MNRAEIINLLVIMRVQLTDIGKDLEGCPHFFRSLRISPMLLEYAVKFDLICIASRTYLSASSRSGLLVRATLMKLGISWFLGLLRKISRQVASAACQFLTLK